MELFFKDWIICFITETAFNWKNRVLKLFYEIFCQFWRWIRIQFAQKLVTNDQYVDFLI